MISYQQLQSEIGRYLGYGRDIALLGQDSEEFADIESSIQSGLRQFYNPPPLDSVGRFGGWSFLRPTATLPLSSSNLSGIYILPNDFGGIVGSLTYPSEMAYQSITITGAQIIRRLLQRGVTRELPTLCAVRPRKIESNEPQSFEILFYPIPNRDIDVEYCYYVSPRPLSQTNPYPYGPDAHSESILESCLSMAELRLNDEKGIHWQTFMERLAASIEYDRKTTGAEFLGYNSDNSDLFGASKRDANGIVTVGGYEYD